MIQLPFALPLSAVSDGQRIHGGQLVFCVHPEAGEPLTPGCPSYRGPCYISMWEEKPGDEGGMASLLLDSVPFSLVKKVSRVLEGEKPKGSPIGSGREPSCKSTERNGAKASEESQTCKGKGVFAFSRFLYRLYFRQPVAISLEPEADGGTAVPAQISWITVAIDENAVTHWDVTSPEDCDKLVLHAMRRGSGKPSRHPGSVSTCVCD